MNEKNLLDKINKAAEYEIKANFSQLMSRIENQSEEEKEQSRKEAIQLMQEENGTGINKNIRNVVGIAAAAFITIGLGVSLVAASLSSFSAEMEAAPSNDCVAEESLTMDSPAEILLDSYNDTELKTDNGSESTQLGGAEKAEPESNTSAAGSTESSGYTICRVDQLKMSLELPAYAYITDRTVSKDFILLEKYDISAAQLEANYKKSDIYYNAVWYDEYADATEIVITKRTDEISEGIFNLKNAGEYDLGRIKEMYLSYGENGAISGAEYFDVTTVSNDQALFLRSLGKVDNSEERSNHLQYMTIVNGDRIEITLIEHFGVESELTGEEPDEVSEAHAEIMEKVIESLEWDNIRSGFLKRYSGITFFAAIAIVGAVAIAVSMIIEQKKLKEDEAAKADKEENASDSLNDVKGDDKAADEEIAENDAESEISAEENSDLDNKQTKEEVE